MLTQVRKSLKGVAMWFVIVLLILAFALFGVPEVSQITGNAAITVGKERFSQQYVQAEFTRAMRSRQAETGQSVNTAEAVASGLHTQVVASISTSSAIDQFANRMNLAMPRSLVRDFLQENPAFHNAATGQFDRNVLIGILRNHNIGVEEFERRISEDLKREQLVSALPTRARAPSALVNAALLRDTEQRRIRYLLVTDEMAGRAQEPTPEDLQTYYDENPAEFTSPEYRVFDLLLLRDEDFRETKEAPEEELRRIYELSKERLYDRPERRTLYQITFETETEAQAAVASLRQGTPFETIAGAEGRSLDSVTFTEAQKRDILDPAVADAAFVNGAEEGAVLDPVQSLFGWTVVQIAGITPPQTTTFEEVRDEIEAQYLESDVQRARNIAVDDIEVERDAGIGLAAAAEAVGFTVDAIGPVDRYSFEPGGAIIDNVPGEALAEVFALEEGEESAALKLAADDGYFFVTLNEVIPPALKPFEEVADEVGDKWRKQERDARISATVRSIRDTVENGASFDEAAETYGRALTEKIIDRRFTDEAISQGFNEQIFSATPGDLVSGPAGLGEAQIVAEITDVGYMIAGIPPDQTQLFEQYMGHQIDQELIEAFLMSVREDYGVKVNQSQLDQIFSEAQ